MSKNSKIEWTEATWNPITGCTKVSSGCKNCYAERMSHRLKAMGNPNYANGFDLTIHKDSFDIPLHWKKPRMIFVNSMSDLFHEDVPKDIIIDLIDIMRKAERHTFQVLTKRSGRLKEIDKFISWPENVWVGVSVENKNVLFRVHDLLETNSKIKFLSLEPLLGPIPKLPQKGVDWVIVGGESGPGARPMNKEWVQDIRDQCKSSNTPFFFKQWGGFNKKKNGRKLDGRTWNQMPSPVSIGV
jgi:protein gp37